MIKIKNRNGKRCYTCDWIKRLKRTPGESGREGRHETRSVVYAITEIVNA